MSIIIRELTDKEELQVCVPLQQKVFGLSPSQTIPMLILDALANNPTRSGLVIGAFDTTNNELIGFSINICTSRPNTLFGVATGVIPEYRNSRVGYMMFNKLVDIAYSLGFHFIECYFNPLLQNLGRLYVSHLRMKGVKFIYNAFPEFENSHRIFGFASTTPISHQLPHDEISFFDIPILDHKTNLDNSDKYLLKIPELKEEKSFFFRSLDMLINKKNYILHNCITQKLDKQRSNFFYLKKVY